MRKPSATLTPPELEIMRVVWSRSEATVRDVYETLLARRKVAYTTVLTVMKVLEAKGYLARHHGERAILYRPTKLERDVERSMVQEFLDRVFAGASRPLLVHLLDDRRLTADELEDLAQEMRSHRRTRKERKR